MDNYREAFKSSIARIYHSNAAVVGAGFLVSEGCLITCAHVVATALGMTSEDFPDNSLELDFPLISPGHKLKAKVIFWRYTEGVKLRLSPSSNEDIAGLELENSPPVGCHPVSLVSSDDFWNHPFQIFGFPKERDLGVWASGVLRDKISTGWVQLEDIKAQGYRIEPGFSGAPIWDDNLKGVVGMAVAAEKKREDVKAAFMIPTYMLCNTWDKLNKVSAKSTSTQPVLSRVKQIRIEALSKRLNDLEEDYKATYNQMSFTLSDLDRKRLNRQAESILEDIYQVENELNLLNN